MRTYAQAPNVMADSMNPLKGRVWVLYLVLSLPFSRAACCRCVMWEVSKLRSKFQREKKGRRPPPHGEEEEDKRERESRAHERARKERTE